MVKNTGENYQQREKNNTAHTMDDIYYDQYKPDLDHYKPDNGHSASYDYIGEYLIGIELI